MLSLMMKQQKQQRHFVCVDDVNGQKTQTMASTPLLHVNKKKMMILVDYNQWPRGKWNVVKIKYDNLF